MEIKTYKVIPYIKKLICECGGEFEEVHEPKNAIENLLGIYLSNNLPQYKYKCSKCGKEHISNKDLKINTIRFGAKDEEIVVLEAEVQDE